ncbi:MAG: hypothetical protein GY728_02865 [Phycisphaeraceae bacterium]|nr:hypothetical protein [Phycisphaeraceae bacterium]
MERGDQSRDQSTESVRCPTCGCVQTTDGDTEAAGPHAARYAARATSCEICGASLGRRPRVVVLESPEPSQVESHWARWLEQRRVERWIWFGFLAGLALAIAAMAIPF